MREMTEVRFFMLSPGARFWFENEEYMKVAGPAERQYQYAVNLTTFKLTYFAPSEHGVYQEGRDILADILES